jgi:hypothetical protein
MERRPQEATEELAPRTLDERRERVRQIEERAARDREERERDVAWRLSRDAILEAIQSGPAAFERHCHGLSHAELRQLSEIVDALAEELDTHLRVATLRSFAPARDCSPN